MIIDQSSDVNFMNNQLTQGKKRRCQTMNRAKNKKIYGLENVNSTSQKN